MIERLDNGMITICAAIVAGDVFEVTVSDSHKWRYVAKHGDTEADVLKSLEAFLKTNGLPKTTPFRSSSMTRKLLPWRDLPAEAR